MISPDNRKNRMLTPAGILMLTAGIFNIIWIVFTFARFIDPKIILRDTWVITPFPYLVLDVGFGGSTVLSSLLVIVFILGMIFSILGGIFALIRRTWSLSMIGSLGSIVCLPLLGIITIILIASS